MKKRFFSTLQAFFLLALASCCVQGQMPEAPNSVAKENPSWEREALYLKASKDKNRSKKELAFRLRQERKARKESLDLAVLDEAPTKRLTISPRTKLIINGFEPGVGMAQVWIYYKNGARANYMEVLNPELIWPGGGIPEVKDGDSFNVVVRIAGRAKASKFLITISAKAELVEYEFLELAPR